MCLFRLNWSFCFRDVYINHKHLMSAWCGTRILWLLSVLFHELIRSCADFLVAGHYCVGFYALESHFRTTLLSNTIELASCWLKKFLKTLIFLSRSSIDILFFPMKTHSNKRARKAKDDVVGMNLHEPESER